MSQGCNKIKSKTLRGNQNKISLFFKLYPVLKIQITNVIIDIPTVNP
jgi:hypothetical protein